MKGNQELLTIKSISQLMRYLGQPTPLHPLIALVNYSTMPAEKFEKGQKVSIDFYKISFKTHFSGQVKYGQGYYDFDEGGLAFLKPGQVVVSSYDMDSYEGYVLYFHPDFIRSYPLANAIMQYGFFSYDVSEALFLSAREKEVISNLFATIAAELENNIDNFSQDVLVSQIELLLNYSNRFYNRQFITRKTINHDILVRFEQLLEGYFKDDNALTNGLPSVHYLSEKLQLSSRYLSDLLKSVTGLNTQQHIQNRVIDEAKNLLSTTALSVAEVAYKLGFEHPQSFHKLFKKKTALSPLAFRESFN
ncbi:AraC family transcriptional regulator [Flavobacterium zepuense]|uniref:AraC family transcriptional regulator n=1 Tax=Flavobacterium zepuense TaxID=2593302 RepID=A0A552UVK6_9FLAO|nr:helix-turn-helix transcriptional regulator [Flavobacterium zepuense]TRW22225.1 AraC family transcriptional regulator [Flavobacterium zepuense]